MLVQSHEGYIELLPALPDVWKDGEVKGFRVRGGFEIADMAWKDGRVVRLTVKSDAGNVMSLRYNGKKKELKTKANKTYRIL